MTQEVFKATGKRKSSVAQVRLSPGEGKFTVNSRTCEDYFCRPTLVMLVKQPLELVGGLGKYDVWAKVDGGGIAGQAGALKLGISRALLLAQEGVRPSLKSAGLLTRDPREKERKKYGQKKARKRFQFSKR
jgi:small subunit ribosomal protein S9